MRAIRIEAFGGAEVLRPQEVPAPVAGPGEALVRVEAAGVNFIDVYHRTGLYPNPLPLIPGLEGAGVVTALGPGPGGFARATGSPGAAAWAPTPSTSPPPWSCWWRCRKACRRGPRRR